MKIKNKKKFTLIASTVLGIPLIGSVAAVAVSCSNDDYHKVSFYYKKPTTGDAKGLVSAYQSSVRQGAKLLVCPGFNQAKAIDDALNNNYDTYKNTGFVLLDASVQTSHTANVASAQFRTDQGSFLTGIALAQYLNDHKDVLGIDDGKGGKKLTWGGYGGMDFSSVTSYLVGVQAGVRFFNEKIQPTDSTNLLKVEQVLLDDGSKNFAGNFNPNGGDAIIDLLLNKKVSALFPVAGSQSIQAVRKVQQAKAKTVVIGVDSQFELSEAAAGKKVEGSDLPIVPFSSIKDLEVITKGILNAINAGKNYEENVKDSNIGGLGYKSLGDLKNSAVGVSPAGQTYLTKAIKAVDATVGDDYKKAVEYVLKQPEYQFTVSPEGGVYFVTDEFANKKTFADIKAAIQSTAANNPYKEALRPLADGEERKAHPGFYIYNDLPETGSAYTKENPASTFTLKDYIKEFTAKKDKDGKLTNEKELIAELKLTKLILNSSTSVLEDQSFSQTSYLGMYLFLKQYKLDIPTPVNSDKLLPSGQ